MFDIPDFKGRRRGFHDQVFKNLLGTFLPDFLALVAPEPAGRLDLSRWELLDKEIFTDWPKGKRRELDLLAAVTLTGNPDRKALIHVEIEARCRPEMGSRLAGYYMQIQLRYGLPVLPILLCLRRGRPGVHLELVAEGAFGLEVGRFTFYSFGLAKSLAEEYLTKDQPLAWALAALMRSESMSRAQHKLACLRRIAAASLADLDRLQLVNCVETYLQLDDREAEELEALQTPGHGEEVRAMRLTWAEQVKKEGLEEGREQGFRQALLRQLSARFGPLSEDTKRRMEAIRSMERLDQIAEQILVARSLAEVGLDS